MQKKVYAAARYLEGMPGNIVQVESVRECLFHNMQPDAAFVLPFDNFMMDIDKNTADAFARLVFASSEDAVMAAARALQLLKEDERMPDGHKLHLAKVRDLCTQLCVTLVLPRAWNSARCICSCIWDAFW